MKTIRLLRTAMIAGLPRSPAEGLQTVSDEEAKNLIANNMAVDADEDIDLGDEDGDGLEAKNVKTLRKLAKDEGAYVEGDANKAAVIAAIRAKRVEVAAAGGSGSDGDGDDDGLDDLDEAALRQIMDVENVVLDGEDPGPASADDIRAAIRTKREQAQA